MNSYHELENKACRKKILFLERLNYLYDITVELLNSVR